jgi:hypothetical protein
MMVVAVGGSALRQSCTYKRRERSEPVDLRNQDIRHLFFLYFLWPADDRRYTSSCLESAVFATAERTARFMCSCKFDCPVNISVVEHRTVVARKNDQCVFAQSCFLKRIDHLSDSPVELKDSLAAQTHRTFASEAFVRESRHMHIVRCQIQEERTILIVIDKIDSVR